MSLINEGKRKKKSNDAKTIMHHLLQVDACTKQWLPWKTEFQILLLLSTLSYGVEHPFEQFGSAVLIVFPFNFLPAPDLFTGGAQSEKQRRSWCCAKTF